MKIDPTKNRLRQIRMVVLIVVAVWGAGLLRMIILPPNTGYLAGFIFSILASAVIGGLIAFFWRVKGSQE
jgi:asparagine N-glycosylation enzyme membrane subunit Stt3